MPERPALNRIGVYFVLSFVFLNLVILINVVVAMMADTYGAMTPLRLGIYSHAVMKTAPAYAPNKHYGPLALLPPPFCAISFLTLPYYLCVKDKARLEKFSRRFNMVAYFFISIIISLAFVVFNLVLLPFAYLKTIGHKITLKNAKLISVCDVVAYVVFGPFSSLIVQVPDLWAFLKTSWMQQRPHSDATFVIDREMFSMFYKIVVDFEK